MKKIADWPVEFPRVGKPLPMPCRHPEHNPPGMIVLSPGIYEHECPGCHRKQTVVQRPEGVLQTRFRTALASPPVSTRRWVF